MVFAPTGAREYARGSISWADAIENAIKIETARHDIRPPIRRLMDFRTFLTVGIFKFAVGDKEPDFDAKNIHRRDLSSLLKADQAVPQME
jgi:hypothetical protein